MYIRNSEVAIVLLAALAATAVSILLSQWTYVQASDGIFLGLFPLAYLLVSMSLIASTLLGKQRHQLLVNLKNASHKGLFRIFVFIGLALFFAFYQQSIGFIPSLFLLALAATISMGVHSPVVLALYSFGSSVFLYMIFTLLGTALQAWPR